MITCAVPMLAGPVSPRARTAPRKAPKAKALARAAAGPAFPGGPLKSFTQVIPGAAARIEMVAVPGGTVTVAAPDGKGAPRKVTLKPFWVARTETPWEVFDAFTTSGPPSPSYDRSPIKPDAIARPSNTYIPPDMGWGHHGYPVICEANLTADMFCRWLSKATGRKYRLPTEAEWEYACRAGAAAAVKPAAGELAKAAWTKENSKGQTHPVGQKQANAWGLYDTLGNVAEWATDLEGKPVVCGGSFADPAPKISSASRARQTPEWQATDPQFPKSRWWLADAPFVGFRIVCEP